ncbi:MAG: DUF362 domain-containing protein [Oscillospiraceae bacterium]
MENSVLSAMKTDEILVTHGKSPAEMTLELLEAANLCALIGDTGKRVGLKPNLVVPRPAGEGATTHPEIVEALVLYLHKHGFRNLVILEGSWLGARTTDAFAACGIVDIAKRHGVALVDTQQDSHATHACAGMDIAICDSAMALDFLINLPVMKGHCQTGLTCALKNHKGLIPNREKRRFHTLGLHRPIAHLATAVHSRFVLADSICGDLDFEEGGNPVHTGRLFAARDPVLCDAWAAQQMGFPAGQVPYIPMAAALGAGCADAGAARVRVLRESAAAGPAPRPTGKAQKLARHISEDSACSACTAALVRALAQLDEGERRRLPGPVCVGQGYRGRTGALGAGQCTAAFAHSAPGCPPTAADLVCFLRENLA